MQHQLQIKRMVEEYLNNSETSQIITEAEIIEWVVNKYLEENKRLIKTINSKVRLCIFQLIEKSDKFLNLHIVSRNPILISVIKKLNIPKLPTDFENLKANNSFNTTISHERDLHPHLEKFLNRLGITSSTIFHEVSKKDFNLYWLHPDMVGVHSTAKTTNTDVNLLWKNLGNSIVDIYSFELKKTLTMSNLRKSFFQAVSNSSWANYVYLVAQNVDMFDSVLMEEFRRLNQEFRIGLMSIDVFDDLKSRIIVPSIKRDNVDKNLINIMSQKNSDFLNFIRNINQVF